MDNTAPNTSEVKVEAKPADVTKAPAWWMKNSQGNPSMSVTFASISFFVTTAIYIASAFEKIGPIMLRPFDVGACAAYFVPSLTLYFGRRLTDAKYSSEVQQ